MLGATRFLESNGHDVLLWSAIPSEDYPDTALYDPVTDHWRLAARSPYVGAVDPEAVYPYEPPKPLHTFDDAGHLWMVMGQLADYPRLYEYDSATDTWSSVVLKDLFDSGYDELTALVWSPPTHELVLMAHVVGDYVAAAYRPSDRTARKLTVPTGVGGQGLFAAQRIWICCGVGGEDALTSWDPAADTWSTYPGAHSYGSRSAGLALARGSVASIAWLHATSAWSGTVFDTASTSFSSIPEPGALVLPFPSRSPAQWASSDAVFLWGGSGDAVETGATYELATGTWRPMPTGGPSFRDGIAVWAGDVAVLVGGDSEVARYRP